jgi:Putative beta barrel porin-7 (BBP7)
MQPLLDAASSHKYREFLMNKSCLASIAALLIWAGATLGQAQSTATGPPSDNVRAPAVIGRVWEEGAPSLAEPFSQTPGAFTADLEYVLWFLANSRDTRPLAATDVTGSANARVVGALGDAEHEKAGPGSGARIALGYWETQDNRWVPGGIRDLGAETVFFFVGQRSAGFMDETSPTIVRPFFDLNNRQESAFIVSAPGLATGGIVAESQASVWGAEANLWKNVYYDYPGTTCCVNVMAGFRFVDLDERLNISSTSAFNQNLAAFPAFLPFAGNTLQVSDAFAAHNHFYGAQIGVAGKWWLMQGLLLEGQAKLAIGATSEELVVAGGQVRTLANGARISSQGGLLALPSNSGRHQIDKFSQVPELNLKLSAPLTSRLTFSTGFSSLYWSRVLRAGQQIDRDLDISQIPNFPAGTSATATGLNQPGLAFKQSDLWVLGINFGLEFKY